MEYSQWDCLLKNAGVWQGSFTQFSPEGQQLSDTPSEVVLQPLAGGQRMRQEIRKQPADGPPTEQVLEYQSLSRAVLFFENGAFSNGSLQWGPFSEFGAELGLIHGDRRLRLVHLFGQDAQLQSLTLIREHRTGSLAQPSPPLQLSDLLGTWRGDAVTRYADLRPETRQQTELTVDPISATQIRQTLRWGNSAPPLASTGTLKGSVLRFEESAQPIQLLLLPGGASATGPTQSRPPCFLEVGWLIEPELRQRLIRRYDAQGAWESLTLVTEKRSSH
jgi:hypothetical protein